MSLPFRAFLESPDYCGFTLSPAMAAIADASEGIQPDIDHDLAVQLFGCGVAELPEAPRRTVAIRAGGRAGKSSRLIAGKALHAGWTVEAPTLRRGEDLYCVIVAPELKLATQDIGFVRGLVEDSPIMARGLLDASREHVRVRRPDGVVFRVEAFAASRGGRSGRGKTLAFAGMDESEFMYDESYSINDVEIHRAHIQRVVPDGQAWIVSTPWIAGQGLLEGIVERDFGRHEHALVAVGGTRLLNPTWDPDGSIERDLREQDPLAASREIDAIPIDSAASSFFSREAIERAIDRDRPVALPFDSRFPHGVGIDAGFTKDSSAAAAVRRRGKLFEVCDLLELIPGPGAPLKPSAVVGDFAKFARRFGRGGVMGDSHYKESIREHLSTAQVVLLKAPEGQKGKGETYAFARTVLHEGRLRLPNNPRLVRQLREIVSKPTPGGGMSITSPRRKGGGHGDLVSALVLAIWQAKTAQPSMNDYEQRGLNRRLARVFGGAGNFDGIGRDDDLGFSADDINPDPERL